MRLSYNINVIQNITSLLLMHHSYKSLDDLLFLLHFYLNKNINN